MLHPERDINFPLKALYLLTEDRSSLITTYSIKKVAINYCFLIQSDRGTGPVKPRQPPLRKVPNPAGIIPEDKGEGYVNNNPLPPPDGDYYSGGTQ